MRLEQKWFVEECERTDYKQSFDGDNDDVLMDGIIASLCRIIREQELEIDMLKLFVLGDPPILATKFNPTPHPQSPCASPQSGAGLPADSMPNPKARHQRKPNPGAR